MADGESVASRVARIGALQEAEAVLIAAEVAKTLQTTYGRGVIHGDVRLQNIQLMPDNTVAVLGSTDTKASPQADTRTDIFALGAALYHMVTGSSPIESKPQWPRQINKDLSESICKVIAKMMATSLEERYQTPTEVVLDMGILAEGGNPVIAASLPSSSTIPLPATAGRTTAKTTKVKARTGLRQTAVRTGSQRKIAARRGGHKRLLAAVGGAAVVLVCGIVLIGLASGPAEKEESGAMSSSPVVAVAPDAATADATTGDASSEAATALRVAREFAAEHPDDIGTAIDLFKQARTLGAGTRVEDEAREELGRLRALAHQRSKKRVDDACAQATKRAGADDIDGALSVIGGLPKWLRDRHAKDVRAATAGIERTGARRIAGVLASVTRLAGARKPDDAERELASLKRIRYEKGIKNAAGRIKAAREAIAAARRAAKRAVVNDAKAAAAKAFSEFDALLAKGDYAGARRHVAAAAKRKSLSFAAARLSAAAAIAKAFQERESALMRGARSLLGKKAVVESAKGKHKGTLEEVTDEHLRVAVDIVDRGRILGQSKMTIAWADLTPGQVEEFLALGTWRSTGDDMCIVNAYRSLHAGEFDAAERFAAAAPSHPLSAHLLGRVASMRKGAAEDAARAAWREVAEPAKVDPLPPKTAKALLPKLEAFVTSHGATGFAKARAKDVEALRGHLERARMVGGLGRGLVGYWKFDDGAGAKATDSSGKGGHGKVVGGQWVPGRIGKALSFDGNGAHVEIGDLPQLRTSGNLTISFWMKPASIGARRNPLGKCYGAEGMMTLEKGGYINFFYGTSGANTQPYVAVSSPRVAADAWAHMVLVRDMKTRKIQWYKDGKSGGARDVAYEKIATSDHPFSIGSGYVHTFHGLMDDVRVYDRALTAKEVSLLFKSAPPLSR